MACFPQSLTGSTRALLVRPHSASFLVGLFSPKKIIAGSVVSFIARFISARCSYGVVERPSPSRLLAALPRMR